VNGIISRDPLRSSLERVGEMSNIIMSLLTYQDIVIPYTDVA